MRSFTNPHRHPGEAGKAHLAALHGKRFPPYAKQLMEARQRGIKPTAVVVLFGNNWSLYPDLPKICLNPSEYAPGLFDFSVLTGHRVIVAYEAGTPEQALDLCHEIAEAGPLELLVRDGDGVTEPSALAGWGAS